MCQTCGCHSAPLEKKLLIIDGMRCGHCKNAVEKAVRGLPGVMAAEVNLEAKTLTINYDPNKSTLSEIQIAIDTAGYEVM